MLKLNEIVVVEDLVAVLPIMHQVIQEAHAALVVEFRQDGR